LESSGSVDIEYAKAEELEENEQADDLLENVIIKVEPEKVSRKEAKKRRDAETRRQIVGEVKKTGLKKMFQVQELPDEDELDEEQAANYKTRQQSEFKALSSRVHNDGNAGEESVEQIKDAKPNQVPASGANL